MPTYEYKCQMCGQEQTKEMSANALYIGILQRKLNKLGVD